MSDYIDENFEDDETDEFWGIEQQAVKEFTAHDNFIKEIDRKAFPLINKPGIRKNYKYVDPRFNCE